MKKLKIPRSLESQMLEVAYSVQSSISRGDLPVLSGYLPAGFSESLFLEFLKKAMDQIEEGQTEPLLITLEFKPIQSYFEFEEETENPSEGS